MVVIEADSPLCSWDGIKAKMGKLFPLLSNYHFQPFSATQAILKVINAKERVWLFNHDRWSHEGRWLSFIPWSSKLNIILEQEISNLNSKWLTVVGVPLSLWNFESFESIGAKCGGLMQVATATKMGWDNTLQKDVFTEICSIAELPSEEMEHSFWLGNSGKIRVGDG